MEVKKSKLEMDNSTNKESGPLSKDMEEKSMPCTSNFEDHSFYNVEDTSEDRCNGDGDASNQKQVEEDEDIDILECSNLDDKNEIEVSECNDGTDGYSSSFSGTVSEHENETALNDQEADSMICNDTSLPFVKKRKLTDHWRRFVQPIMWRSKWIELKIKEFQRQTQMYDKEVEESCLAKQLELQNLKSEELGIKVLPSLPCHTQQTLLKKRKKRKHVEETPDAPPNASNHNLFSYHECRKSFADISLNDNPRNLDKRNKNSKDETVFCEDTPLLEFREGDAYLEQILMKIEAAKSEARNLKNRVDKILSKNPSKSSLANTENPPGSANVFTSSEQQKPQLVIKNEVEELIVSEEKPVKSASVSSHHNTPEEEETTDILLSDMLASKRREGKAIASDKKLNITKQTSVEGGPSRSVRKRTPRKFEVMTKEETNPKRNRVSREKPKSNAMMASRFKLPNRKRKRGKRRSGSTGLRRS